MDAVILGLDGVDPALFEQWASNLPNLRRLKEEGIYARLESTTPPLSSPAWPAFATGKRPGKLGFYGFNVRTEGYSRETVNFSHWSGHVNLWNILNAEGYTTGVMGMPVTYPPEEVDGVMIANMPAPLDGDITFPQELREELDDVVGGYEMETAKSNRDTDDYTMLEERWRVMEKQQKAAKHLLDTRDLDVFLYVIAAPDRIGHHYWKYMGADHPQHVDDAGLQDALKETYERCDTYVGEILDRIDDDATVFVLSDHGFGPKHGVFYVNQWLRENGYLSLEETRRTTLLGRVGITKQGLMKVLRRLNIERLKDLMPAPVKDRLSATLPEDANRQSLENANIDWEQTKAVSLDAHCIWINTAEREEEGSVAAEDVQEIRRDIMNGLEDLVHPETGEPLNVEVRQGEEVYGEDAEDGRPDIVFTIEHKRWDIGTSIGKLYETNPSENGDHRKDGIFIAQGPDINEAADVQGLHIADVTPTILHAANCPVSRDMDGRVHTELFTGEPAERTVTKKEIPKDRIAHNWGAEEEEIKERLQGLGYME